MSNNFVEYLDGLWRGLESEQEPQSGRLYKRLELKGERGLRASIRFPEKSRELMIALGRGDGADSIDFPPWSGVEFELLELDIPIKGTVHLAIRSKEDEYKDVYLMLCGDLVESLSELDDGSERAIEIDSFLDRWTRFFEFFRNNGLPKNRQRGLFGELLFLRKAFDSGLECKRILGSWIGCKGAPIDFDFQGHAVEVKTTISKEPRRVKISSEKQLDDTGFLSLHLFVCTLVVSRQGGTTLPGLIQELREDFSAKSICARSFEKALVSAGYSDIHKEQYVQTYTEVKEEVFQVAEGFPRIICAASGVGDISYSLSVSACTQFLRNLEILLDEVLKK